MRLLIAQLVAVRWCIISSVESLLLDTLGPLAKGCYHVVQFFGAFQSTALIAALFERLMVFDEEHKAAEARFDDVMSSTSMMPMSKLVWYVG